MSRRVVHAVRSDSFAGVERYMCDVGAALADRGWDVVLVGGDPALMRGIVGDDVELHPAAGTADVAGVLRRLGRPDLVHAHMSAAELAAVATRPLHRAPVVATRHFDRPRGQGSRTGAVTRLAARGLAAEISISDFVARETGPGSVVVPNGVPRQPLRAAPAGPPYVLTLQRLEKEKDPLTVLRAWELSGLADRGWTLKVAGRGAERDAVAAAMAEGKLGDSVQLLGFVPEPDELLRGAQCLLATAPREPFGLSVVEALARGVPVVAASGGAHLETLQGSSLLFPPGDAQRAAAALLRVAQNDPDVAAESVRLRARQQERFSIDTHVDGLERIYTDVLRSR